MTDHPTPTPDPADPWRGRFPPPGGPMPPPPAPGGAPYPGPLGPVPPGGPPARSRGPLLAVAVIVVVALVAVAGAILVVRDGDEDDHAAEEADGTVFDLVTAQRDLLWALQDERNLASLDLMGLTDTVSLALDDPDDMRRATDEAIAALLSLVEPGPATPAYQPAIERLRGLADVRSSVDSYAGPRSFDAIDTSNQIFDSYGLVIDGLIEAEGDFALTVDDPDLRAGVEVHRLGLRQQELFVRLVQATVTNALAPGDPAGLTTASEIYDQLGQGRDDLTAAATGTPYEAIAVEALADVDAAGAVDLMGQALEGPVDIEAMLDAVVVDPEQGWFAFLRRVEDRLADAG